MRVQMHAQVRCRASAALDSRDGYGTLIEAPILPINCRAYFRAQDAELRYNQVALAPLTKLRLLQQRL